MSNKNLDKPVTNRDLVEFGKAMTSGIEKMFIDQDKKLEERFDKLDERFNKIEERLDDLELEVQDLKKEVRHIRSDLSDKVDRSEFNKLKIKVDRYIRS